MRAVTLPLIALLLTSPPALAETAGPVTDAKAMARAIETTGRVALDGIHFDFGSAVVLPTSDAALTEIAALLAQQPDLQVYVVSHTDSLGALEPNLDLSQARAKAVVSALEGQYGVAPGRAVPAGVGPLAPLAPNTTDAGRALNRRIEIVAR